ncbi:hypothetical protein F8388_014864 [Cannabis sativa]|uniref:Uncharacterized protein n=1 Tax=Cannabis sativa TaxID=3483 RepID=A0A7J6F672_CANSA|nr:hypothetical protein F8388_014864 [Cannabis sativa]
MTLVRCSGCGRSVPTLSAAPELSWLTTSTDITAASVSCGVAGLIGRPATVVAWQLCRIVE